MSKRGAYYSLTLAKKVEVLREVERGVKRKCDIAKEYGIQPNTLSTFIKNKERILESWTQQSGRAHRKRVRGGEYPEVDECIVRWFRQCREQNIVLNGPLVRSKAEEFAEKLGVMGFKASSGWLTGLKERNGISFKSASAECDARDNDKTQVWYEILTQLIANYDARDVFSVDETALYHKCTPDNTAAYTADGCHGARRNKERVTLLAGANMDGSEKLPLLMIGATARPRCFKGVHSLPIRYEANKRAWITCELFERWLLDVDLQMCRSSRQILLFIDNCSAHKIVPQLRSIKVVYIPPSMTVAAQPMAQGAMQSLKHFYRRQVVLRMVDSATERLEINLLDANRMLHSAWSQVTSQTLADSFRRAGFQHEPTDHCALGPPSIADDLELPAIPEQWLQIVTDTSYDAYIAVDDEVAVCGELTDDEILQSVLQHAEPSDRSADGDDDDGGGGGGDDAPTTVEVRQLKKDTTPPTPSEAVHMVDALRRFVEARSNVRDETFQAINDIDDFVRNIKRETNPTKHNYRPPLEWFLCK